MLIVDRSAAVPLVPLRVTELWFPRAGERFAPALRHLLCAIRVFNAERPLPQMPGRWIREMTLLTQLADFDQLWEQFPVSLRRELQRALTRDQLHFVDNWSAEQFLRFFAEHDPDNPGPPVPQRLRSLEASGNMRFRAVYQNERALCAHAYLETPQGRVLVLHAFTERRADLSKSDQALVSRANKALHYTALQAYRDRGFAQYDWGGYSGQDNYGPDEFKLRFRGTIVETWHLRTWLQPLRASLQF